MPTTGTTGPTILELQNELDPWVESQLGDWRPERTASKVVRDPIHDFISLEPHEVAVLNTPLMQRLGYIHQTSFTYLVYRGAHHTRLDHSIGVLHTSQTMLDALDRVSGVVNEETRVHVRLAALLHDVGHIIFSHLGEVILDNHLRSRLLRARREPCNGINRFFNRVAFGEILGYLIVTSEPFTRWFSQCVAPFIPTSRGGFSLNNLDFTRIGRMIVGKPVSESPWPVHIINGSFDADKLDYIMRDCYFAGIRSEVDTSRLIHSLAVINGPRFHLSLGVKGGSINYLEQLILAKLTLYTAVYHHHKVRALECMFQAFYEKLYEQEEAGTSSIFLPANLGGWFDLTEADFFTAGVREPLAGAVARRIRNRRLLKRCLILDRTTMIEESFTELTNLAPTLRDIAEQRSLRERIYAELSPEAQTDISDLWIDIPGPPDVDDEAKRCYVALSDQDVEQLSALVPAEGWVKSYAVNKLKGHVFFEPSLDGRKSAANAVERVLRDEYDLRLKPIASRLALK